MAPSALDGHRIAIVLLSAIGDVVQALPLAASIRGAAPRARLEWIVQPVAAEIVRHHPAVDRVWVLERHRGWRGFRDLRRRTRDERFDLVLVPQVYGKASLATLLLQADRKLGFDRDRSRELGWLATAERLAAAPPRQVGEQYLEFADHLGIPRRYTWDLPLTSAERAAQRSFYGRLERPLAALIVGTSRSYKEWPAVCWAGLADGFTELGYWPCLVGGGGARERSLADHIADLARRPIGKLQGPDLRRLLWILDGAALAVGCDTGPYHIAIALDVPSIGLYGATNPARVGPNRRFLELVVDAYHDAGEPWHPVRSEVRRGRMDRISCDRVMDAVLLARARYPRAAEGPAWARVPGSA